MSSEMHFGGLEVLQILMVTLDQDLVIHAREIVSPLFHCLDNHQEILIVRVVVLFGGRVYLRLSINWENDRKSVVLVKDAGDCDATCIGQQND